MHKLIKYGIEGVEATAVGINKAADAAKGTLGPKGCNATYLGIGKRVVSTKDGASILNELDSFADPYENLGLMLVRQVTKQTVDTAGDGTTTATVLFQHMVNLGLGYLRAIASESMQNGTKKDLAAGVRHGVDRAVEFFRKESHPLHSADDKLELSKIREVASISVNDGDMGKLIADLMYNIGSSGVVAVEDSRTFETTTEQMEGMKFDQGFKSSLFVTNRSKQICELENAHVLVYNKKLDSHQHMIMMRDLFENIVQADPLLIIAEDISDTVMLFLEANSLRKSIKVCAVKAPGFGDTRTDLLEDIATFVGAKCLPGNEPNSDKIERHHLGNAKKIIVTDKSTTIISGNANAQELADRCEMIRNKIEHETSEYSKKKLEERLAKLVGKAGVIRVGGKTETDQKELKDRIDDAVQAVRAAISGGILPGGGTMHIRASEMLRKLASDFQRKGSHSTSFIWGIEVVAEALMSPLRNMLINAGLSSKAPIIIAEVSKKSEDHKNFGFNVASGEYVQDMVKEGIIDPTECAVSAAQNAGYQAARFLEMSCVIVDKPADTSSKGGDSMMDMPY